jgi:glycosyltransferase involved in cell wall biosynthesis
MRLLFLSKDYPSPYQPADGLFNLYLTRALATEHAVEVISPVPWVDEWKAYWRGSERIGRQRHKVMEGVPVHYPRYYYPPRIGRSYTGWFYWWSIRRTVKEVIARHPPDAVIAYWAHPDGEAAVRVGRALSIPSLVIVGGSDVLLLPRDRGRRRCVSRVLEQVDAVVTVNQDLKAKVVELGIAPDKVHVWSQGVDDRRFHPGDQAEARKELGLPLEGRQLLWVGRMVPVKALDVLLKACALLRDRSVLYHLYLVGDGPLRGALEKQAASLGLEGCVTFVGTQGHDQVPHWYRAADVTLLPSWSEGLPNVLRESLACGTPFVASRVGGIAEIATSPACRLVPAGDAAALAEAIAAAVGEPQRVPQGGPGSGSWQESARALTGILEPLVSASGERRLTAVGR